jgi:hypothetical protein
MPLKGGSSDKLGNYYEGLWTVNCFLRIINGDFDVIRLEPPGQEGDGVEFWLEKSEEPVFAPKNPVNDDDYKDELAQILDEENPDTISTSVNTSKQYHYYQVKRQKTSAGKWSLADLNTAGILNRYSNN